MYSNKLICNILLYIDDNIKNKITINDLCDKYHYNRYYIMKLFKKELNISIIDYINIVKIYNSLQSIKNNYSFLSCALTNGYFSLEYYSEMFKKVLGVNPSTYKKIIFNPKLIDDKTIDNLTIKLSDIKRIINKCNTYKNNLKPDKIPTKVLSIFN